MKINSLRISVAFNRHYFKFFKIGDRLENKVWTSKIISILNFKIRLSESFQKRIANLGKTLPN